MAGRWSRILAACAALSGSLAGEGGAQPLGSFSWQLAPYCNVITVSVRQDGNVYTLDGYDNQCGAAERAAVSGTAFLNPNGSVGVGLTTVTSPGGVAVHLEAAISIVTLAGTWRDSHGNSGAMTFSPSNATGSPRPLGTGDIPDGSITSAKLADGAVTGSKIADGTIGASDINSSQVQRRIAAGCPPDQTMTAVNIDGSVDCAPAAGSITAVTAGPGLLGGGTSGSVQLRVSFGGTGSQSSAARSDHVHGTSTGGGANTSIGAGALETATPGSNNTAVGTDVLGVNLAAGNGNTGVGAYALRDQQEGTQNTAVGSFALQSNTSGSMNTAIGREALLRLVGQSPGVGSRNTAIGKQALADLSDGYTNTAIGAFAGDDLTSGRDNIYIGSAAGGATESFTTRIGTGFAASRTFVAGIRGVTTGQSNAVTVVIDSTGQLGTVSSSRRTKFDIARVDSPVTEALQRLRPVQFRYRQAYADGSTPLQYGLIAEEVNDVLPGLVALGTDGTPETVKYHVLPSLLLADVQRLERERKRIEADIARTIAALEQRLDEQAKTIEALRAELSAARVR